ncbi:MAG: hypothetical protein R6W90_13745 [Ignavibacteriaceae bacterium]
MIDLLKEKVALFVVNRQLKHNPQAEVSFTNFFSSSFSFFVLMPEDEKDFIRAFEVLNFLEESRKNILIYTYDYKVSLLPIKFRQKALGHGVADVSKWKLPSKSYQGKLNGLRFDAAIDLNRKDNLYCSFSANLVQARIRIGFSKSGSDKFYNLQVADNEDSAELSYKNLLNCLSMF